MIDSNGGCIGRFCWQNQQAGGLRITDYHDLGGEALVVVSRRAVELPGFCFWRQASGLSSAL